MMIFCGRWGNELIIISYQISKAAIAGCLAFGDDFWQTAAKNDIWLFLCVRFWQGNPGDDVCGGCSSAASSSVIRRRR
jgi:hypothetical protein